MKGIGKVDESKMLNNIKNRREARVKNNLKERNIGRIERDGSTLRKKKRRKCFTN